MPFDRPSLMELKQRAAADLNANLAGTDALLRRSNTNVLATVHGGAAHGLYGHLDYLAKQLMPDTAEAEYLLRHAAIWGITPNEASCSSGQAIITGVNGAIIPAGSTLQRQDSVVYTVTAEAVIVAGTVTVELVSQDGGITGNAVSGSQLTLISPIDGVDSTALIAASGLTGGTDDETDASILARLLDRIQRPPAGGNRFDYVTWAKEVNYVQAAWVIPCGQGPGTIDLVVLADEAATGSIIPTADLLAAVRAHIVDICPDDVKFFRVLAPILKSLDLTISLIPDTAAIRASVQIEIDDLLLRERELFLAKQATASTVPLSRINEAISTTAGESDHILTAPVADFAYSPYELPVPGIFTWL